MSSSPANPPIRARFTLLSSLGVFGALTFIPSILASATPPPPIAQSFFFALIVSLLCIPSAWFGLRFADAAHLPMPYLRRLDHISSAPSKNGFLPATVFAGLFAAVAIFVLRHFHQPNLPGPLWTRIASVFFAAGSLEIVIHLFLMSMVVRFTARRISPPASSENAPRRASIWLGIVAAAIVFTAFHAVGAVGQAPALLASTILLNGIFGVGLGVLYARYGFESVLLCHAIGHILAVTLA